MKSYMRLYITPEDILGKLSDKDKKKYVNAVFTDVQISSDGYIEFTVNLLEKEEDSKNTGIRYKLFPLESKLDLE